MTPGWAQGSEDSVLPGGGKGWVQGQAGPDGSGLREACLEPQFPHLSNGSKVAVNEALRVGRMKHTKNHSP